MQTNQHFEPEPQDAHVQLANKIFRDVGFSLAAMQFKREPAALEGIKRFNRVPDNWKHPFAWNYHPNIYMRNNWRKYYG